MKRVSTIIMALVMVMTMAQCKKNEETNLNKTVTITLDVKGASTGSATSGSKVVVNPSTGTVDFETGDKVYVGSGGKYVGFLTHNGTNFVGNITNPTENQPLQFYFLGNVTPQETLSAGTTEECSVIITDQTEHLPVISCAASYENYVSGVTSYTSHLLNKCALVKFNVTTPSNSPICITGMKNKVTVDFTQNTVTPSIDGEGVIMLPAGSGENVEKWAILLPQEALEEGEEGSAYTEDGIYIGTRPAVPTIMGNGYLADGITISVEVIGVPIGAINGLFSVSDSKHVYFSQGNLQYIGSAAIPYWKFADNQWDYLGDNGQGSTNQNVDRDLFGWGTSGYNHGAIAYQPWSTSSDFRQYYAYGDSGCNLWSQTGQADWGYNAISNGGNMENIGWRTLTATEWIYVFNTRTTSTINGEANARYTKAIVSGNKGVILFPDFYTHPDGVAQPTGINNSSIDYDNIYTESDFALMEINGAVFFPAAGSRNNTSLSNAGLYGRYWSSSYVSGYSEYTHQMSFSPYNLYPSNGVSRYYGHSVRLVHDAE